MFCGLGEVERTRFRKKKRKSKKKKKPHRGQKWVVRDERYFETYSRVKHFCRTKAVFDLRRLFTPNFRGGFRIVKQKSRNQLPQNLVQKCN